MRSMTGIGTATGESPRLQVAVSLRSVNHRFLDLSIRLREEYRELEPRIREVLAAGLSRGRVEVRVEIEQPGFAGTEVEINRRLVETVAAAWRELAVEGLVSTDLAAGDLLRVPEVLRVVRASEAVDDADRQAVVEVVEEALGQLIEARETEGQQLAAALRDRLAALAEVVEELTAGRERVRESLGEALRERVRSLLADAELPEERLAQEIALLLEKSDIQEELDRLRAHLEHFETLLGEAVPIGKRLDFLTQELFREISTVGAKTRDTEMVRRVLDAKSICEQLREQVQNIE